VCAWIHDTYDYARAVTSASSPIDDLLSTGKGVCQDFAHLMIAVLRSYQIPARYISGYIHRPNEESQSHAWCEAWIPDLGWVGLDPTNNSEITDHFVKVAVGRNFTDVPPNKGVYRGTGEETIRARVETRELARQPTLSWQEQLPKLHVPLTVVLAHLKRELTDQEEVEQEQQQQQ
jgi:transglutaminase-like putative cysteine protease